MAITFHLCWQKKKESSNFTKMSYYNQKESVMVLYANNKDTT